MAVFFLLANMGKRGTFLHNCLFYINVNVSGSTLSSLSAKFALRINVCLFSCKVALKYQ